ncbi:MAG: insulinase family protein [Patescibacteria group bacterium]|nr:insulinase family protein [Patescibacteria group bacterium]
MFTLESLGVKYKKINIGEIPLHFFERKGSPLYIRVMIQAGSRYDIKEGTAHFLEHMLVAGTKNFLSKELLAEYIENVGGVFSLITNSDFIYINIEIAQAQDLPVAMNLLNEILNETLFDSESLENERKAIISEQINKHANHRDFVWVVYKRLFFQKTDISKSVLGDKESLKTITMNDLMEFKKKYFTKSNIAIIASGDVNSEILEQELEKILSKEIDTIVPQNPSQLPVVREKRFDVEVYPSKQVSVIIGFRTVALTLHDKACQHICASYLAGGRASLLIKELRYKKGLVYGITALPSVYKDRSSFTLKIDCETEKLKEVLEIVNKNLQDIKSNGISEDRLSFMKSKIVKNCFITLQTSEALVEFNGILEIAPESGNIEDYLLILNSVSTKDILDFVQKNFLTENMFIAGCGSKTVEDLIHSF